MRSGKRLASTRDGLGVGCEYYQIDLKEREVVLERGRVKNLGMSYYSW
jgi:hypothetical protein